MTDSQKTKKLFWIILALAFFMFAIYGFLFWNIKVKNEKASELLNTIIESGNKDQALRSIKNSLEQNKDSLNRVDSYFVNTDGAVGFIEGLEKLASDGGVSLTIGGVNNEIDTKVKNDFKEILRLRVDVSGSWANVVSFISALETLPFRVQIETVSLGLTSAADKLAFQSLADTVQRKPSSDERWKASFEFTVIKLK